MRIRLRLLCLHSLLLMALALGAQAAPVHAQRDDEFLAEAVQIAQGVQRETGVPASVIIAQAIMESGWGRSPIADAKNYFGMKAFEKPDGTINTGPIAAGWVWAATREWDGTQYVNARERFRSYKSMADSFADLAHLYVHNERYAAAMQQTGDPRQFAREIAAAGYATAPGYADKLIEIMDTYDLYQYDVRDAEPEPLKPDEASFVGQSDYLTLGPGASFQIFFQLENDGSNTWRSTDGYILRNSNDQPLGAISEQGLGEDIPPGEAVRWTIPMKAPAEPGLYRTSWRLYHGQQPFGPELYIDVKVGEPPLFSPDFGRAAVGLLATAAALGLLAGYLLVVRRAATRA